MVGDRRFDKRGAVAGRGDGLCGLVGWLPNGCKEDTIESEFHAGRFGQDKVGVVRRIERPAQNAEAQASISGRHVRALFTARELGAQKLRGKGTGLMCYEIRP